MNWTRDGKLPDTTNKLTVKQVTYEHAGQYTCSAKNSEGKNEASFTFSLQVTLFIFCSFFSRIFIFFELCLSIPSPGPPGINPGLKNQSVTYIRTLLLVKSLSTIVPVNP